MRSLLALGNSWTSPQTQKLQHDHPILEEDYYQGLAKKLEPLSSAEEATLEDTKNQLIQNCMVEKIGSCINKLGLGEK